jgi:mono/diheme cytochrome c family protein
MRKPLKIALFVAAALAVVGGLLLRQTLRTGFSTHHDPPAVEVFLARAMRKAAAPADLRGARNPLPLTAAALAEGRSHWADHCASCHGNDGKGQTTLGKGMYPRAPDMTLEATQDLSDGELFAIIENGIRLTGMPGWGNGTAESAYGTWGLVHFIRHLPKVTADEIAEMEALNPKSPAEWEQMRAEQEFLRGSSTPPPAASHDATPHGH